jgi:hypothetical protein
VELMLKLTRNEVIEAENAFGITPLFSNALRQAAGIEQDTTYNLLHPDQFKSDSIERIHHDNNVNWNDLIHDIIDGLFGFSDGMIDRPHGGNYVVMKDRKVINWWGDPNYVELMCVDGETVEIDGVKYSSDDIDYGMYSVNLGETVKS